MKHYQHRFERIEDYLHHRPPYLMVDSIRSLERARIITEKKFTGSEFFSDGHFPGAPILPGAMMQEMTTQSAGILLAAEYNPMQEFDTSDPFFNEYALGVLVKVTRARYREFARPGDTLIAEVALEESVGEFFDFTASVSAAGRTIMRNGFRLTNIRSEVLKG